MSSRQLDLLTTRHPRVLAPTREDLVDAVALFGLGLISLLEFHTTFAGWSFLVVGAIGLLLGTVIAHTANVLRQPVLVLVIMGLAAFFVLGGAVTLRGDPGVSVIPTVGTLRGLASESIHGWRDLLTTVPPVDGSGPLLVLPYLLGLFLGLGGFALARRLRGVFWPLLAPLAVFVAVIVLGSLSLGAAGLTATAFAVGALVWISVRKQRVRPVVATGAAKMTRIGLTVALFAIAGCGAYFVGPSLPGMDAQNRVLVRKHIVPPFDVGDYPSPLGEFRHYNEDIKIGPSALGLGNTKLFSVTGTLPAGSPIVFATLDAYNGSVWAVTNVSGLISGKPNSFLRVGHQVDNPAQGHLYTMDVKVDAYNDYWIPTSGAIQAVQFGGPNGAPDASEFRYNLATGTGVVPNRLWSVDSYDLSVAGVTAPVLTSADNLSGGADTTPGEFLNDAATSLAGTGGSLASQVLTMARNLRDEGKYSTGAPGSGFEYYLPGESMARLSDFVNGVIPGVKYVGDDEQYAAAFALMIEQLGVPARVLIGVEHIRTGGGVLGKDVTAWVEVRSADGAWLTIPSKEFISSAAPDKHRLPQGSQETAGSEVPPPAQGHPKSNLNNSAASSSSSRDLHHKSNSGKHQLPEWLTAALFVVIPPLLAIAVICGTIIAAKSVRRRRRRILGTPSARLARGWREVIDHARDLGIVPTVHRSTRREQALQLGALNLGPLAVLTDRYVFGPEAITDGDARTVWTRADAERKRMSADVGRLRRWLAVVNIVTFFPRSGGGSATNGRVPRRRIR